MTRNTVADDVLRALHHHPEGMSDAQLAKRLDKNHPHINQVCHRLANRGLIAREETPDGIVNKIRDGSPPPSADIRANRKNIYVRDADLDVWERAERLAQEPISALVSRLLGNYVQQREAVTHRIVVAAKDQADNVTRKAFKGRMLVSDYVSGDPPAMAHVRYHAAQGAGGSLALWYQESDGHAGRFRTYDDLSAAMSEGWPTDFLSAASSALGEEYAEEIDL